MNYTYNWNTEFIKNVKLFNISNLDLCLEIGCFEGLTSNYICDNMLSNTGKLYCIDPLLDSYIVENPSQDDLLDNENHFTYFKGQFERFIENTNTNRNKIILLRDTSSNAFKNLNDILFDFIYIDGDHRPDYVYNDAINSFKHCKTNGIILFDDYIWLEHKGEESTKFGIDKFLNEYNGKYELLLCEYQVMIKKL